MSNPMPDLMSMAIEARNVVRRMILHESPQIPLGPVHTNELAPVFEYQAPV
jgi:hypothetical protein